MKFFPNDILSYREMCDVEKTQTLQRGMNFRLNPGYSVILMSQRSNAPYNDRLHDDGITIEYEGHDVSRISHDHNPKREDQARYLPSGRPTQNGLFIQAVENYKLTQQNPERVKAYEKILPGVWSFKGLFNLIDYKVVEDKNRKVFRFLLQLDQNQDIDETKDTFDISHTRLIPSEIKKEVWKRDAGKCVLCGSVKNLHFDHDLPFSRGGASILVQNIRLLCARCNLKKSDKIE